MEPKHSSILNEAELELIPGLWNMGGPYVSGSHVYLCKSLIYIFIYKILTSGTLQKENFLHLKKELNGILGCFAFLNA